MISIFTLHCSFVLCFAQADPDVLPSLSNGFKMVAIVEDFFSIIYGVHVEMDGRGGKHAGQKRTYRAVSERQTKRQRDKGRTRRQTCRTKENLQSGE